MGGDAAAYKNFNSTRFSWCSIQFSIVAKPVSPHPERLLNRVVLSSLSCQSLHWQLLRKNIFISLPGRSPISPYARLAGEGPTVPDEQVSPGDAS